MAHALIKALTPGDISHDDLVRGGAIVRRCSNAYESGNGDPMPLFVPLPLVVPLSSPSFCVILRRFLT